MAPSAPAPKTSAWHKLSPGLWTLDSSIPSLPFERRMTVCQLATGELLIHSCIALDEPGYAELESWGTPAFLIVPNAFHTLDTHIYQQRYPKICTLAPEKSQHEVAKKVTLNGSYAELPADPHLQVQTLRGSKAGEAAFVYQSGAETSLIFNDTIFNLPHLPGFKGLLLRWLGSTGGPRVTRLARSLLVSDKAKLAEHLQQLSQMPQLKRIIPGHGAIIDAQASESLSRIAHSLCPALSKKPSTPA